MRILYLMQYFISPEGSYSTRTYEFARRLVLQGHEVTLITSNAIMPEYQDIQAVTEVEIAGIHCVVIPTPAPYAAGISFWKRIKSYIQFNLSALRQVMRFPANLVVASSPPLPISIPAIWARLWHRIPMVFEVRDLWPAKPIALGALKNPVVRSAAIFLEWLTYHMSSHVIALSPGTVDGIKKRGIPSSRISFIPNSSDVDFFQQETHPERIRERLGITESDPLIVYTGAFGLINGVGYMVELAYHTRSLQPDVHFLLVGSGVDKQAIMDRAQELGLLDATVHIWNPMPKREIPDILAAATIATSFCIPLEIIWENSANKFFDGLAAGKPVAINYGGWQAELLNTTGAGLVLEPNDPYRAAQQLTDFLKNEAKLSEAAKAAFDLACAEFDRNMLAKKLEQVLLQASQP